MNDTKQPEFIGKILIDGKLSGTGFIVNLQERLVATAFHVIEIEDTNIPFEPAKIAFQPINWTSPIPVSRIVATRLKNQEDIALLELAGLLPPTIEIPDLIPTVPTGSSCYVTGFNQEYEKKRGIDLYKSPQGVISGGAGHGNFTRIYLDKISVVKGMSGGPVTVPGKGVVGVLTDGGRGIAQAFMVPISFLESMDERVETVRRRYLRELAEKIRGQRSRTFELGTYIPLPVEVADSFKSDKARERVSSVLDIPQTLTQYVLLGEPGSGKSITLDELILNAISRCQSDPGARIPLRIDLQRWEDSRVNFIQFLEAEFKSDSIFKKLKYLGTIDEFVPDKVYLYLDGLDELQDKNARILKQWLQDTRVPSVISCRETEFIGIKQFDLPIVYITPLNERAIYDFSVQRLGRVEADRFVSHILPKGYVERDEQNDISQLAQKPFFLLLLLNQYREKGWATLSNRWSLFEGTVNRAWKADRIQTELGDLGLTHTLSEPREITRILMQIAVKNLTRTWIDKKDVGLDERLLEIIHESGLMTLNDNGSEIRFRHQLFADYFAANSLIEADLSAYAAKHDWLGALVVLAGHPQSHARVQQALLKAIVDERTSSQAWIVRKQIWALGEIGDAGVLNVLLTLLHQVPEKSYLFSAVARIANRLTDDNPQKQLVIETLKKATEIGFIDREGDVLYELLGDVMAAPEALAEIKSETALHTLVEIYNDLEKRFQNQVASGGMLRQQWFAEYFASMGEWAIPKLIDYLDTDNFGLSSTVSEALLRFKRPLDVEPIAKILETHPNPAARENAALTLGKLKQLEAIPYLINALNDTDFWARGSQVAGWRYFFVADSAAQALAYIGTTDCTTALTAHQYDDNGNCTLDLLLYRLDTVSESIFNVYSQDTLKTYLAHIVATRSGGTEALIPRMGHFNDVEYQGYKLKDPIAAALIQRFDYANAKDRSFSPTPHNYTDITPQLLNHLVTSQDDLSRKWCCVVLGRIGSPETLSILDTLARNSHQNELRLAVSYAAACIRIRNSDPDIDTLYSILNLLGNASPESYGSIGLGLTYMAVKIKDSNPKIVITAIRRLCEHISGHDVKAAAVALDSLECLYQETPDLFDGQAQHIIDTSPSYQVKLGDDKILENEYWERFSYGKHNIDYKEAFLHYEKARVCKLAPHPAWRIRFSEGDWEKLGCGDSQLHFQIAKVKVALEDWENAFRAFNMAQTVLTNRPSLTPAEQAVLLACLVEMANILFRFLDDEQSAKHYYDRSIEVAESITTLTWNTDPGLFLNGVANFQQILMQEGDFEAVLRVGKRAVALSQKLKHKFEEELADILVHMSEAQAVLGENQLALSYIEQAEENLKRSGRLRFKASVILEKAKLKHQMQIHHDVEQDILKAKRIFEKLQAKEGLALALSTLADLVYRDTRPSLAISTYVEALGLLDANEDKENVTGLKIEILHHLALVYQKQNDYPEAKRYFNEAIHALQTTGDAPPYVLYIIKTDYAKLQHEMGQHTEAVELLTQLLREQMRPGLDPSYTAHVLEEIDTQPGLHFPTSGIRRIVSTAKSIVRGAGEKEEYIDYLDKVASDAEDRKWRHEVEFLNALSNLIAEQPNHIDTVNPYFEFYKEVLDSAHKEEKIIDVVLSRVREVFKQSPDEREKLKDQITLLGFRSRLQGDEKQEMLFGALYEYVTGKSIQQIIDMFDLKDSFIRTLQTMDEMIKSDE